MLHWFAGQKLPETAIDQDNTGYIEPPETPAPVFAVRAFKHAIFGTPQTVQPKPRRHSSTERERQKLNTAKPARPNLTRPKSASDAVLLIKLDDDALEPMASPTKGILMTPGTAAARRKTVTFGDHVIDNEGKKAQEGSKSGIPDDCPGKFPSPWVKATDAAQKEETKGEDRKWIRGRLTDELLKAREESDKAKPEKGGKEGCGPLAEGQEPNCETGLYWKREYDIYRGNTMREVKKLVTKQKVAKSYARERDFECTDLADQLQHEKKKVGNLEKRNAELEAQMKELKQQLDKERAKTERVRADGLAQKSTSSDGAATLRERPKPSFVQPENRSTKGAGQTRECLPKSSGPSTAAKQEQPAADLPKVAQAEDAAKRDVPDPTLQGEGDRGSSRPQTVRSRTHPEKCARKQAVDIWTGNIASSSPAITVAPPLPSEQQQIGSTSRIGRTVTSGTNLTPLKSMSINTMQKGRTSSPGERPARPTSTERKRQGPLTPTHELSKPNLLRRDSLDPRMALSSHPVQQPVAAPGTPTARPLPDVPGSEEEPMSPLVPESSPFNIEATHKPDHNNTHRPSTRRVDSKENVSPSTSKSAPRAAAKSVPYLPAGGKRIVSKEGVEVPEDRVAAAKARIAARGRPVS